MKQKPRMKVYASSADAMSFGEVENINYGMADYLDIYITGMEHSYYTPPISRNFIYELSDANAHHGSALVFKRNQITKWFDENPLLTRDELGKTAIDFATFGECYFQLLTNRFGQVTKVIALPAYYMRKSVDKDRFVLLQKGGKEVHFAAGEVVQIKNDDTKQSIYGKPEYIPGMHSVLLNKCATKFRIKYYENGAHMGYVFLSTDPNIDDEAKQNLKEQIKSSKGVGNFKSMFVHVPDGGADCIKIIPVGDIAQKDEFKIIKEVTRNDVLAMHRLQPALAGVMPENVGGFGDIEKIQKVYWENETQPLQHKFLLLNEHLPKDKQIQFVDPPFTTSV